MVWTFFVHIVVLDPCSGLQETYEFNKEDECPLLSPKRCRVIVTFFSSTTLEGNVMERSSSQSFK